MLSASRKSCERQKFVLRVLEELYVGNQKIVMEVTEEMCFFLAGRMSGQPTSSQLKQSLVWS